MTGSISSIAHRVPARRSSPVARVRASLYRIPRPIWWSQPLGDATTDIDSIELILARIATGDGLEGLGYTYTLGRGGSSVFEMLRTEVLPMVLGAVPDDVQAIYRRATGSLQRVGRAGVVPMAIAASDIALWDLKAKAAGEPLYRHLGALRTDIPAYGSAVDLSYERDEVIAGVTTYCDSGFTAVKVKVGRSAEQDRARVSAVRDAIGADRLLMIDANLGWDLPTALSRMRGLEDLDLTWIEEPLAPEDVAGHARLQRSIRTPVAVGETLFSPTEFAGYIRDGAAMVLQPDAARIGGITPFLEVAALAAAANLPLAPHFLQDIHIHLLCAAPTAMYLEYLPFLDRLLEDPLPVDRGRAAPPERAGHGVAFQSAVMSAHLMADSGWLEA